MLKRLCLAIAVLVLLSGIEPSRSHAYQELTTRCDLWAVPTGDDGTGDGTRAAPFKTAQRLVDSLSGDPATNRGCLLPGVYAENVVIHNSGTPSVYLFLTSGGCCELKDRATIDGSVVIAPEAANVEVDALTLTRHVGAGPVISVLGDGGDVASNDITNPTGGSCVAVGAADRQPDRVVAIGNLLHGCGSAGQTGAPAVDLQNAMNFSVRMNYVYANPGTAIEVGPNAKKGSVTYNLIDGNEQGVRYQGDASSAPSEVTFLANIASASSGFHVAHDYPGPAGTSNQITANCVDKADAYQPGQADVASDNILADPAYQDRASPPSGYALSPGSGCARRGPRPIVNVPTRSTSIDPLAPIVDETSFGTYLRSNWQLTTYHFEWAVGLHQKPPFPNRTEEAVSVPLGPTKANDLGQSYFRSQSVGGLDPNQAYTFRIVTTNGSGIFIGRSVSFTVGPPLPLRPPYRVTLVQAGAAGKRSTRLRALVVTGAPNGAQISISCVIHAVGCPTQPRIFTSTGSRMRLFKGRRIGTGGRLAVAVSIPDRKQDPSGTSPDPLDPGSVLFQKVTHATITTFGIRSRRPPLRSESCVGAAAFPCLEIRIPTNGPFVRFAKVINVPPGTEVTYVCHGRRCPHRRRTITTSSQYASGQAVTFNEFRRLRMTAGTRIEIAVTRPKTVGVAAVVNLHTKRASRLDGCIDADHVRRFLLLQRCPIR